MPSQRCRLSTWKLLNFRLFAGIALLLVLSPAGSFELAPYRATYTLSHANVVLAQAHYVLEHLGEDQWALASDITPSPWLTWWRQDHIQEHSRFQLVPGATLPDRYRMRYDSPNGTHIESITFDHVHQRAISQFRDRETELATPANAMDRLSLQIAIRQAAASGEKEFSCVLLERDRVRAHHFRVEQAQSLQTAAGRFETVRVVQTNARQPMVFWLAPKAGYLPIRLQTNRSDRQFRLDLLELDGNF